MARHHMIDGEKVMFTAEEETARDAEEAAWEDEKPARAFTGLRNRRNELLHDTDWVATKALEAGGPVPDPWQVYRQALRDLPATLDNSSILSFDMESGFPSKP